MKEQTYLDVIYHSQEGKYPQLLADYLVDKYFNKGNKILDIGAGRGQYITAFRRKTPKQPLGMQAFGIIRAQPDYPTLFIDYVDLETEPIDYPDEHFDYIFSKSCIEHIWNTEHLLAETYRVLQAGGTAVFMTPDWKTDYKYFWDDPTHVKPFTRKSLQNAFKIAGFVDVECKYFYQLPFLWRRPYLEPLRWLISLLPNRLKWKDKEQTKQRVLIRHSKERMLLCVARKPKRRLHYLTLL